MKRTKKILFGILGCIALVALVLTQVPNLPQYKILSVDRIWLHQRGIDGGDGELKGGFWRVTATSSDTKVQFLELNQTYMKENEQYPEDFPDDVVVESKITVEVSQYQNPYWVIPITNLGTIEVVPEMQGINLYDGATGGILALNKEVHLWGLNLAMKKVVIPFRVVAVKTQGENTSPLVTDDYRAELVSTEYGNVYDFQISQSDVVNGDLSAIIFYNPLDSEEWLKLNLEWSFGDYDRYSWDENLLFITPLDGFEDSPPYTEMTFKADDSFNIRQQLNWQSGSDWTFNRYWYGGGDVFQGTAVYNTLHGYYISSSNIIEQYGKSTAMIGTPYDEELIAEGYTSGLTDPATIYEYGGWYTPSPNAPELWGDSPSDWHEWRYPLEPNIYSNVEAQPAEGGQSIVNYLASAYYTPVTHLTHVGFERKNPDIWGYGIGGNIGENGQIGVVLPPTARQWLFTLDISTELADTVVVQEDYINVKRDGELTFDRYTLAADETAYGTVTLDNLSPWSGRASISIRPPENIAGSCQISGGGSYYFDAEEQDRQVNFQITNTGLLSEDQTGEFRFSITNQQPYETDHQTFTMTFKAGIGVPDSLLDVTTKDADTGEKVSGITIKAVYGMYNEHNKVGTTNDGECVLDLGKFEGPVTVSAIDYQERYEGKETVVWVESGSNPVTFHLIRKGSGVPSGFDWETVVMVLGVAAIVAVVVVYLAKGSKRRGRRR